ncbi:hypothetical protein [Halobacteriaceae bacterium SHR40]|uniref:hypothetical protein n=1 Tax=Halovenus amylolytica TaxID=2500550 RepID=UPI000FE2EC58
MTAGVTGMAGCLGSGNSGEEQSEPGASVDTEDEFLRSVADPSSQIPPKYFAGYQYRISDLLEHADPIEILPDVQGSVSARAIIETFNSQFEGIVLADLDRIVGSTYRSQGIAAGLDIEVPSGEGIHVTGTFDAAPIADFFNTNDLFESVGEASGFEQFIRQREQIDEFRAFAVADDQFVATRRTNVSVEPAEALALEFEQIERESAPIVQSAPAFADVVATLDDGPIRVGVGYALLPLGSDTGTAAFDDVIRGVDGTGVSATPGEETELQRSISYLDEGMGSESTIRDAFEASETDEIPATDWSFSKTGATISARTTQDGTLPVAIFRTALQVPGYNDLFTPISPSDLGREAPPRIFFQPMIEDGILEIKHAGGSTGTDLQVRYVHDGEVQHEFWDGEVSEGETFTSEQTVDGGTQSWVTWRPDTVDAAVLVRFETPS